MGDVMCQSLDLLIGQRLCGHRHTTINIGAGLSFEPAQLF